MKRSLKATACLCAAIMSLSAMSVTSFAETNPDNGTAVTAPAEKKTPKAKNVKFGKVTAVNGSDITVALGEFSAKKDETKKDDSAKKPESGDTTAAKKEKPSAKPEKKASDSTEKDTTATTDNADKKPFGKGGNKRGGKGAGMGEFTENGSTLTVTVNENVTLKKNGKSVTASDISVGEILTLEYNDDEELVGIRVKGEKSDKAQKPDKTDKTDKTAKEKGSRKSRKTDAQQTVDA